MQIAPYALLFKQLFQCNFAFRGVCNRCASARPSGPFGSGAGAVGHGRGRVANDSGVPGRSVGGPTGLFGPNETSGCLSLIICLLSCAV